MTAVFEGRPVHRPRRPALAALAVSALTLAGCGGPGGYDPIGYSASAHRPTAHCGRIVRPVRTTLDDWKPTLKAMGRPGEMTNGVVFRFPLPRRDLRVRSRGVLIQSSLALNGDAAFTRYCDGSTMLMGDLVLTDREVPRVTDALQAAGIGQTALHKHLLDQTPSVWWTHFEAMGDPVVLARKLRAVLARTKTPHIRSLTPPRQVRLDLDTDGIDAALGRSGMAEGRIYKFFIPRVETVVSRGHVIPPEMGVTTVIKFQALGDGRAAINGDLLVTADEVQRAIRAMRKGGITPVELHNHMLDEHPRLFFLHYWATGDGVELARALRPALDQTRLVPAKDVFGKAHAGGKVHTGGPAHGRQHVAVRRPGSAADRPCGTDSGRHGKRTGRH